MAIVDTIINATAVRQPIEHPGDNLWTLIPRGWVHFVSSGGTLDAKPATDQQHLRISGALPAGFAYTFQAIAFTLTQDVANNWDNRAVLRCVNWVPNAGLTQHIVYALEDADEINDATAEIPIQVMRGLVGEPGIWGRQVIFNPGFTASFSFLAHNEDTNAGAAGTVDFCASFLEYDLTQATRMGLQSPVPTTSR